MKYILSLLNSKLLKFWYQTIIQEKGKTFAEVKITYLERIPVPHISLSQQKPFIEKADFMLEKNKDLQVLVQKFLKRLNSSFDIDKLSKKLEKFYDLEFSEFVKELGKMKSNKGSGPLVKIKMTLRDQDEWEEYFDSYKKEILELKNEIDNCDKEIDEMVFELYGLNESERKIILENN